MFNHFITQADMHDITASATCLPDSTVECERRKPGLRRITPSTTHVTGHLDQFRTLFPAQLAGGDELFQLRSQAPDRCALLLCQQFGVTFNCAAGTLAIKKTSFYTCKSRPVACAG